MRLFVQNMFVSRQVFLFRQPFRQPFGRSHQPERNVLIVCIIHWVFTGNYCILLPSFCGLPLWGWKSFLIDKSCIELRAWPTVFHHSLPKALPFFVVTLSTHHSQKGTSKIMSHLSKLHPRLALRSIFFRLPFFVISLGANAPLIMLRLAMLPGRGCNSE